MTVFSIDAELVKFGDISSTDAQGDLTLTEAKTEIHCSNPKIFDLINKGELDAYYVGTQLRIKRPSIIEYKIRHAYIPRKTTA